MEKARPAMEGIAANKYVSAIRDGFIAAMPIILFSSIFLMVAYVPNAWGFYWPTDVENNIVLAYTYSMGLLALFVAGTTAKALTDTLNLDLPKTNQVNPIAVIITSEISLIILAVLPLDGGGVDLTYLGTKGLIAAYIVGLIVPKFYHLCISNNVTITLPPQVPGNIAQTFKDVIPMALSVSVFWLISVAFTTFTGSNLPMWIISVLSPLFSASDSYAGLAIIAGATAFFWFVGVQGPSVVQPAISAIMVANTEANLQLMQAGQQATHILCVNTYDYVCNFGGTGATFVVAFLMILVCKSDELKAVGKAAVVPGCFSVNEPVLFGAPIIMNPAMFLPFILTPILNVWMLKFFVEMFGMNSFVYTMPWTVPAPIGILISTGFAPLAFLLVPLMLLVDVLVYMPFLKAYDKQLCEKEEVREETIEAGADGAAVLTAAAPAATEEAVATKTAEPAEKTADKPAVAPAGGLTKQTDVLVLCAGGGTSGILANALNKLAEDRSLPLSAAASSYGQNMDMIKDMDLVILAPQVASQKDNLQKICDKYGVGLATTSGRQYISLTNNPDEALDFVIANVPDKQ
jgi:PTS system lactose-specific IIC component